MVVVISFIIVRLYVCYVVMWFCYYKICFFDFLYLLFLRMIRMVYNFVVFFFFRLFLVVSGMLGCVYVCVYVYVNICVVVIGGVV